MNIIPVIDLKDGHVVNAQQGHRESYQPIKSKICKSSAIEDIIKAYLLIHPFKNIYIADLNEITNKGTNNDLINAIIKQNPDIEFWIDSGKQAHEITAITDKKYRPIIGSESQDTIKTESLKQNLANSILSLDFFPNQGYLGPSELINNPKLWPNDIIIMTLDKVGKKQGPDFKIIRSILEKAPDKNFIAAGGIRHEQDLLDLKQIGIQHALIASALHSGEINHQTIKKLISST